jgi:hypothetical protein
MSNSWLARQRKSELVELAQTIGLKEYVTPELKLSPSSLPTLGRYLEEGNRHLRFLPSYAVFII